MSNRFTACSKYGPTMHAPFDSAWQTAGPGIIVAYDGSFNRTSVDVRWRRNTALADLARDHAQAICAPDRGQIDIPSDNRTHIGFKNFCPPDRHHQRGIPLHRGRTAA